MDSEYAQSMVDGANTPPRSPVDYSEFERAVIAWQEYEANNNSPIDPNTILEVLSAPAPTTKTNPVLPPHREWGNLATMKSRVIAARLEILKKRCATTHNNLDNAFATFEISTLIFLGKRTPTSSEEVAEYIGAFTKAQIAGQAIFTPQDAYHSAVTTLSMFVTDLADILLGRNVLKDRVMSQVKMDTKKVEQDKSGARKVLRGLADRTSKGKETHALMVYMETFKQRFKSLSEVEGSLKERAEECFGKAV